MELPPRLVSLRAVPRAQRSAPFSQGHPGAAGTRVRRRTVRTQLALGRWARNGDLYLHLLARALPLLQGGKFARANGKLSLKFNPEEVETSGNARSSNAAAPPSTPSAQQPALERVLQDPQGGRSARAVCASDGKHTSLLHVE